MKLLIYDPTILAIDLRHRRFGYAVFEGHRTLIDCGIRIYRAAGDAEMTMVSKRLTALFKLFAPSAIVITKERWDRAETSIHMHLLISAVVREASSRAIPIHLITQSNVRVSFDNLGCKNKDEIAEALANIFPELRWRLPPKRKVWQSEHPRMIIFDAVALGLAYWQHPSEEISSLPDNDLLD
jgi:hypothetical protein